MRYHQNGYLSDLARLCIASALYLIGASFGETNAEKTEHVIVSCFHINMGLNKCLPLLHQWPQLVSSEIHALTQCKTCLQTYYRKYGRQLCQVNKRSVPKSLWARFCLAHPRREVWFFCTLDPRRSEGLPRRPQTPCAWDPQMRSENRKRKLRSRQFK